nr:alpha/beta hydrolase [Microbacterium bovistercoris]
MTTALTIAVFAAAALLPLRPRRSTPFNVQFALSWWMNELPFIGLWWLLAGTLATLLNPGSSFWWWLIAALTLAVTLILAWILVRARFARRALTAALQNVYGPRGRPHETRSPWWRIVLLPIVAWRPDVRRIRNRRYGPARFGNLLDVYVSRRRNRQARAPVLVYLHGGGGDKAIFAHALMYQLAARGWVCMSANYRMLRVNYGDQLADAQDAMSWARRHAEEFGGDPASVIAIGASLGANLAASAALSGAQVRGVVCLYGYYGSAGATGTGPHSPAGRITSEAPPFLVVHGAQDTLVRREDARDFAERLKSRSQEPVVYAELPGANHNFDFFPSLRLHAVGDAIQRFTKITVGEAAA